MIAGFPVKEKCCEMIGTNVNKRTNHLRSDSHFEMKHLMFAGLPRTVLRHHVGRRLALQGPPVRLSGCVRGRLLHAPSVHQLETAQLLP